jgi:hypothetical protein
MTVINLGKCNVEGCTKQRILFQNSCLLHTTLHEVKPIMTDSVSYYVVNVDTPIHEDDWDSYGDVDDWWDYKFEDDESVILDYYLNEATNKERSYLKHLLKIGNTPEQGFHHALFLVIAEFGA